MQQEHSKAIVLRSIPFKDNQKILSLFSEHFGLISLLVKGISPKKPSTNSLCELFCEAEFIFSRGNSDLKKFQDGSLLNLHLPLRNKLSYLKTASSMTHALLKSQMPETPAPHLYALLSSFLKQIPSFESQETLLGCFYLKLLKHEGTYHKESFPTSIATKERELLSALSCIQSFKELKELSLSTSLFSHLESSFLSEIS